MRLGWLRGKGPVDLDTPVHEPGTAAEWRLIQVQDRILRADETIRRALAERSYGPDVLLEVMVALGTAPAADDAPVMPGRTT